MDSNYIITKLVSYGVPLRDAEILAAVAMGESGYNPSAAKDDSIETSYGLFQINIDAHYPKLKNWTKSNDMTVWKEWLKNPDNNIFAASQVYHSQGLGAWTVYKTGAYKQYMGQTFPVKGDPAASVPATAQESTWERVKKFNLLMIQGKWQEAVKYYNSWTFDGGKTTLGEIDQKATEGMIEGPGWIAEKVQLVLLIIVGLVLGVAGLMLVARQELAGPVKEVVTGGS